MNTPLFTTISLALLGFAVAASSVKSESYTTKEDVSSSRTLFISQFVFEGDQPRGDLYAEVGDRSLAVGKSPDGKSFQISWSEEHKLAGAGTYVVRIYNEEGYSNIRKARRDGENADNVAPITTFDVNHQGVWKGFWLSSEVVACCVAVILLYSAYAKKSEILS